MLCFSRSGSIYSDYGIHLGCNFYAHGFKIVDPQWRDGFGVNATINFVQILSMNSNGTVASWGPNGRMVFKDGILMDLNYYEQEVKIPKLITNTNEVVINEGTLKKDVVKKQKAKEDKNILLLEEINRKLDLLLREKEEEHGETNY